MTMWDSLQDINIKQKAKPHFEVLPMEASLVNQKSKKILYFYIPILGAQSLFIKLHSVISALRSLVEMLSWVKLQAVSLEFPLLV